MRRRITSVADGANVYLSVLIEELNTAGFSVWLFFAPESSFGDLPASSVAPAIATRCDGVRWSQAVRIGRWAISFSPLVFRRFLLRCLLEIKCLFIRRQTKPPSRTSQPLPESEARSLAAEIDALDPQLVVAEYSALGPLLAHVKAPRATRAILLHDLFSLRIESLRRHAAPADVATVSLKQEAADCSPAELLIYASQMERAAISPFLPGRTHHWLAPARPHRPVAYGQRPETNAAAAAVFMGVRHGGNLDALNWLMTEIWPKTIAAAPGARLKIVGELCTAMKPEWRRLPGVTTLGVIKDLTEIGGPDAIGLAPTRLASGISIKVADYLSLDMPVVASSVALEGYGARLDKAVMVADGAEEFALALAGLLSSPERRRTLAAQIPKLALCNDDNLALAQTLHDIAQGRRI